MTFYRSLISSLSQPLTTTNLLPVYRFVYSGHFQYRNFFYKLNHTSGLLWLAFSLSTIFLGVSMFYHGLVLSSFLWPINILLYGCTIFCPFIIEHGLFPLFLFIMSNAAMNNCAHTFMWTYVFNSLGCLYKSQMTRSYGNYLTF